MKRPLRPMTTREPDAALYSMYYGLIDDPGAPQPAELGLVPRWW